jgi:small conductance mechanosensitive channel
MFTQKFNELIDKLIKLSASYLPKFVLAMIVLIVGWWLVKRIVVVLIKAMQKKEFDPSLHSFLKSTISIALKVVLLITVAGMIGIQTTSLVAILGAAGLAVGLALQGSLSNFAGGALILAFKPFKVGDVIETGAYSGEVKDIQIFNTILLTADHKTVFVPNGVLSNGIIVNYTARGDIRAEIQLRVSSTHSSEQVRKIVMQLIENDERILKSPDPQVLVSGFGNDVLNIIVRFFTPVNSRISIESELWEKIKIEFEKQGIQEAKTYTFVKQA